jgi:replicative DNA helicase
MTLSAFDALLPANIDAEKTILGAILLDNAAHSEAAEKIEADDFSLESHQRIFRRMSELIDRDHAVDLVTLAEELTRNKEIESIGGVAYLASLTEGLPRRPVIGEYIRIVKEKATLRRVMAIWSTAIARAADQSEYSAELMADTEQRLMDVATSCPEPNAAASSKRAFDALLARRDAPDLYQVPTGCPPLDDKIGGWQQGELSVIGARPGQGKSSLLIQSLLLCGRIGIPAHCFQFEMTEDQMLWRMWAAMTGINALKVRNPVMLNVSELERIRAAQEETARFPLVIDTDPEFDAAKIVARARMSKRRWGTRFFGIDYLQRIRFDGQPEFLHRDITAACVKLANLAKREHVAVVALSSLTERGNSEPTLADLRQSGDIQYEAATVVLLHRPTDENGTIVRDGYMNVTKNRNSPTGIVNVHFTPTLTFERIG